MREASGLALGLGADLGGKARYRKPIAFDAEAGKAGKGGHGGEGVMAETLAGVDVADVNFDRWNVDALDRVMQRDRGVRIAARIDDDARRFPGMGLMDEVDQFAFAIGLATVGLEAVLRGGLHAELLHIGELGMPIGLRLANPQK